MIVKRPLKTRDAAELGHLYPHDLHAPAVIQKPVCLDNRRREKSFFREPFDAFLIIGESDQGVSADDRIARPQMVSLFDVHHQARQNAQDHHGEHDHQGDGRDGAVGRLPPQKIPPDQKQLEHNFFRFT